MRGSSRKSEQEATRENEKNWESFQISGRGGEVLLVGEFSPIIRVGTEPLPLGSEGEDEPKVLVDEPSGALQGSPTAYLWDMTWVFLLSVPLPLTACLIMDPEKHSCYWENRPAGDRACAVNSPHLLGTRCVFSVFPSKVQGELQLIKLIGFLERLFLCFSSQSENIPYFPPKSPFCLGPWQDGQFCVPLTPKHRDSEVSSELTYAILYAQLGFVS